MTSFNIRYATHDDIENYYKGFAKPSQSMKAMVMEAEGRIVGIAGVAMHRSGLVAFSEMQPGIPKKAIWKGVLAFRSFMADIKAPILALASKEHCNSRKFLERVGFEYVGELVDGGVFIWRKQQQ